MHWQRACQLVVGLAVFCLLSASLFSAVSAGEPFNHAGLTVCGEIDENTTWLAGSIVVTCDVHVLPGITLTIQPGVVVQFEHQDDDLIVAGSLIAIGTASDPILFKPLSGTAPGSWGRIQLTPGSSGMLDHTVFEYGAHEFGMLHVSSDQVQLLNSTVRFGAATGIAIEGASPIISNTHILSNTAAVLWSSACGGGVYVDAGSPTIMNSEFRGNNAITPTYRDLRNRTENEAAALGNWNSTFSGRFLQDDTYNLMVGWSAYGGGICVNSGSPTIMNSEFRNNNAVVSNYEYPSTVAEGGAIFVAGSPAISGNVFTNNTATVLHADGIKSASGGGISVGITVGGSGPIIENNLFQGNTVSISGSGTAVGGGARLSNSTIRGNTFLDNTTSGNGGGLWNNGTGTVEDNVFRGNVASGLGGGIYCTGENSIIQRNWIEDNSAMSGRGGGVLSGGDVTIRGNTIISNTAIDTSGNPEGGGIRIQGDTYSSPVIEDNTIEGNSTLGVSGIAGKGGGIYLSAVTSLIRNNRLSSNSSRDGGAMYLDCCTPMVTKNTVQGNSARDAGGGIVIGQTTNALIEGNLISENYLTWYWDAGGIYNYGVDTVIQNNILDGNQHGGGLTNAGNGSFGANLLVQNNTFSHNDRGIFDPSDTSIIRSNIVISNTGYGIQGRIIPGPSPQSEVDYNDVWDNAGGNYYFINVGPNNISADPLLANPWQGDFHLLAGSPAIDVADPDDFPATDFAGIPRPVGVGPDIGAFEFVTYPNPDLDGDGDVDIYDVQAIAENWEAPAVWPVDQNGDGKIDIVDIQIVCAHFGE